MTPQLIERARTARFVAAVYAVGWGAFLALLASLVFIPGGMRLLGAEDAAPELTTLFSDWFAASMLAPFPLGAMFSLVLQRVSLAANPSVAPWVLPCLASLFLPTIPLALVLWGLDRELEKLARPPRPSRGLRWMVATPLPLLAGCLGVVLGLKDMTLALSLVMLVGFVLCAAGRISMALSVRRMLGDVVDAFDVDGLRVGNTEPVSGG